MLQSIRDRTHGWIAGVIISLVILSFALWGIHSYMEASANNEVIAKVNGIEISKRQLSSAFDPLRNQAQMNLGTSVLPEAMENRLRSQALDTLINIQVLRQSSISNHFTISDPQVEGYLERMPDFQVNGEFSIPRLKQILANNMLSIGDFLELIKTTLLIDQPRLGVILTSFALPEEINQAVTLVNQERDISYLMLPRSAFLTAAINIPAEDVKAYYEAHENEFKTPQQLTIEYIELSLKDIMASLHPEAETLKNYYNDNINSYTVPMQWKLEKILIPVAEITTADDIDAAMKKVTDLQEQIKKGADFAALAHQYPDTGATDNWTSLNEFPAEMQKEVGTLTKEGQVSEPIKVAKGLMLIKVVGIKQAEVKPYDQVATKVNDALVHQLAEEKYNDLREKLANVSYEHPDSLEPAAKELGLPVKTSQLFTHAKGNADDITSNRKIREAAFSDDVLSSQNNSDAIQLGGDTTVVLRVKTQVAATLLNLDPVQAQIIEQLKTKKAEQLAEAQANEIKQKLQSGTSPDLIAQQYHLSWNKVGYIGRYSHTVDSAILYAAFRIPKATNSATAQYDETKVPEGFAVVASNGVRNGTIPDASKEQYDVFADQVQTSQGMLEYKLYEQALLAKAKIKIYTDNPDNKQDS